jgi:hypothetical protein
MDHTTSQQAQTKNPPMGDWFSNDTDVVIDSQPPHVAVEIPTTVDAAATGSETPLTPLSRTRTSVNNDMDSNSNQNGTLSTRATITGVLPAIVRATDRSRPFSACHLCYR